MYIKQNGAQGEPGLVQVETCSAILMQTYNNPPDHGSSVGSFYRYVTPSVTAEMLFGEKDPAGSTAFEVAYNAADDSTSWGELQMNIGVDNATRLYMAMMAKADPHLAMPNNLGNVLWTTDLAPSPSNPFSQYHREGTGRRKPALSPLSLLTNTSSVTWGDSFTRNLNRRELCNAQFTCRRAG